MVSEQPAHTGIPIPNPPAEIPLGLVLYIKAVTGRTKIGAGTAIDTTLMNLVPDRMFVELQYVSGIDIIHFDLRGDACLGLLLIAGRLIDIFLTSFRKIGSQGLTFISHRMDKESVSKVG